MLTELRHRQGLLAPDMHAGIGGDFHPGRIHHSYPRRRSGLGRVPPGSTASRPQSADRGGKGIAAVRTGAPMPVERSSRVGPGGTPRHQPPASVLAKGPPAAAAITKRGSSLSGRPASQLRRHDVAFSPLKSPHPVRPGGLGPSRGCRLPSARHGWRTPLPPHPSGASPRLLLGGRTGCIGKS